MSWYRVELFVRYDDVDDDAVDEVMDRVNDSLSDADEVIIDCCNQQHPCIKNNPKEELDRELKKAKKKK